MKTFKQFVKESENSTNAPSRVYRVDPVDRKDPWKKSDFAVIKNKESNQIAGTAPISDNQDVKPGGKYLGHTVDRVEKQIAFATPHRPNSFYGAFGRKAGPNGTPVKGAAIYDEHKMFGGDSKHSDYKGELHTTQSDYDAIPEHVRVHSASGEGWKNENYSGKDEVTTSADIKDTDSQIVKTRDLLHSQYKVIIHPNLESIRSHLEKVAKENPHLSQLSQL